MRRQEKEEGYTLVVIASLIIVFLGFTALSIDMGVLYSARASAQRAADSAALAGAFSFVVQPTAPQPATAQQHAISVAATNKVLGAVVTIGTGDVNVDVPNRRVTVDVIINQSTLFARVLGENAATIRVRAIAEAALTATGTSCVKPWFLANTALSDLATPPVTGPCDACAQGKVLIQLDSVSGEYQVTNWGKSLIQDGLNQFTIKESDPHDALAPGQFYEIDPPGGADQYKTSIEQCVTTPFYCGEIKTPLTGNRIGPTVQGVKNLIGCPDPDRYVSAGQYQPAAGGPPRDTSRALVTVAVWDVCNMPGFCPDGDFPSGTTVEIPIIGFALVFIEGLVPPGNPGATPDCNSNTVKARLINISACGNIGGAGGGGGPAPSTGTAGVPVRLVR